jgi:hypothetical protein
MAQGARRLGENLDLSSVISLERGSDLFERVLKTPSLEDLTSSSISWMLGQITCCASEPKSIKSAKKKWRPDAPIHLFDPQMHIQRQTL